MIVADFTGKLMPNEETAAVHVLVFLRNNYQETIIKKQISRNIKNTVEC